MIWFIGAGPGDPKLLTIKGKEVIEEADVLIYAGSLVNEKILDFRKEGAVVYNSACMTLPEILSVMQESESKGLLTARIHTGDPSIYGAIREQMDALKDLGIPYQVIPGVSSFSGAAASLKCEYTLPGVSQTVILTRMEGRTSVPGTEKIADLARHRSSMVIFLSVGQIDDLVAALLPSYGQDTPAAVVYKATWEDERIVRGTLKTIADQVKEAKITRTALVLVGDFLDTTYERSKLYDENFTTGYRSSRKE